MSEFRIDEVYPRPRWIVWKALTDPALVPLWTSTGRGGRPEGFVPEIGNRLRFVGKPFPGNKPRVQFAATGKYSDNSTLDVTNQVTWASATQGVATINAAGSQALTIGSRPFGSDSNPTAIRPPLADIDELRERDHREIGGDGDRRAVKVSARDDFIVGGEDHGVVRGGIGLGRQGRPGKGERIARCTVCLRRTPK